MSFIDDYKEIRKCFISFKKRQYFDIFSSADIFYVIDSFGKKAILTFIDQFFGNAKGLQVFNNRDGINYVPADEEGERGNPDDERNRPVCT